MENHGPGMGARDGTRVLESCEASRLRLDAVLLFAVVVLVLLVLFRFSSFGLFEFSFSAIIVSLESLGTCSECNHAFLVTLL